MSDLKVLACETEGCPVLKTGRCLEGFEDPTQCPHSRTEVTEDDSAEVREDEEAGQNKEADTQAPSAPPDAVELGGGDSLTMRQSDLLANKFGARVVLIAGDFQCGKTTLIAEIYGRFLKGTYCDWSFAGSDCLIALDGRYHGTRYVSGLMHPDVGRTEDEEMRLVDLRLRADKDLSLMLSDLKGEYFDNIVEGSAVEKEVPLASRADRVVLLLDGEKIAEDSARNGMITWSRQLIGGLTEAGGLRAGTPVAIVLSKADVVDEDHTAWFRERANGLVALAQERGCGDTSVFEIAARPDAAPHDPEDLQPVFEWITADIEQAISPPAPPDPEQRSFWRWSGT